jgi:galactokinase
MIVQVIGFAGVSAFEGNTPLNASHESSRTNFENSSPELDQLVELARSLPGVLGARLTGGGFGGATINLVKHHEAQSFMDHMESEYEKAVNVKMTPIVCQIVDGAQ